MKAKLYQEMAQLVDARLRCIATKSEWAANHTDRLQALVKDHLPSGSGLDCGTAIDLDKSKPEKLVFNTSFHHMNDAGMYDGWTEHSIVITPSLRWGFDLRITGKNRNDIKAYLHDIYNEALNTEV